MERVCKKGKGYKRSEREKSMWKVAKGKRGEGAEMRQRRKEMGTENGEYERSVIF